MREVSEGVQLAGEGASGYSFFVLTEGSGSPTQPEIAAEIERVMRERMPE